MRMQGWRDDDLNQTVDALALLVQAVEEELAAEAGVETHDLAGVPWRQHLVEDHLVLSSWRQQVVEYHLVLSSWRQHLDKQVVEDHLE